MSPVFWIGIVGSIILLTWAARPGEKWLKSPIQSIKNWLFAIWGVIMLVYAILWFMTWWSIFFVLLESLIVISSILMMLNTNDHIDTIVLSISGIILIIRSLFLFEGYSTIIFILGLAWLGLGYAWNMGSLRRNIALSLGAILLALFSYLEVNRVFFWLNLFFALFSLWYTIKRLRSKKSD